ncbi:MAG: hypothetical protein ACRC9X_07160, partial [Bacteroidales bacterium]
EQVAPWTLYENLEHLLIKKIPQIKASSSAELYAKLLRFGLAKGFTYQEVAKLAKNLIRHLPEREDLET